MKQGEVKVEAVRCAPTPWCGKQSVWFGLAGLWHGVHQSLKGGANDAVVGTVCVDDNNWSRVSSSGSVWSSRPRLASAFALFPLSLSDCKALTPCASAWPVRSVWYVVGSCRSRSAPLNGSETIGGRDRRRPSRLYARYLAVQYLQATTDQRAHQHCDRSYCSTFTTVMVAQLTRLTVTAAQAAASGAGTGTFFRIATRRTDRLENKTRLRFVCKRRESVRLMRESRVFTGCFL